MLSEKGQGPCDYDAEGLTLLHRIVSSKKEEHIETLKTILEYGADPNLPTRAKNIMGWTPLHLSVLHENLPMVDLFVAYGAEVNKGSDEKDTPLHVAAFTGNASLVCALLAHGANPTLRNDDGNTPLDIAFQENHPELEPLLSGTGLPVDTRTARLGYSLCAMLDMAKALGVIQTEENFPVLPSVVPIFEKASSEFAEYVLKQPSHLIEKVMYQSCRYLWCKALEAVFLWAASSDGKVAITFNLEKSFEQRAHTSLPPKLDVIVQASTEEFHFYLTAHKMAIMRHQSKMSSSIMAKELTVTLQYMPLIGIAYAMSKDYHNGSCD